MKEDERLMRCSVRPEEAGGGLVAFMAARFDYHTAGEWAGFVSAGALTVNGAAPAPGLALRAGDIIRYRSTRPEPPVDKAVSVLYEDADIIVVNKPGNLPAHPAGRYFNNTLWALLRESLGVAEPGIINRLDRETSGVTLVARHPAADAACRRQFAERGVVKKYTALVEGRLEGPLTCRGYMAPCNSSVIRKKRRFEPSEEAAPAAGREPAWAETLLTPLGSAGGICAVEALPHTGRMHQIRATLAALGLPVVGDKVYGMDEGLFTRFLDDSLTADDSARLRLRRQALHAGELTFRHPADGRVMTVKAPLPADMAGLCAGLGLKL